MNIRRHDPILISVNPSRPEPSGKRGLEQFKDTVNIDSTPEQIDQVIRQAPPQTASKKPNNLFGVASVIAQSPTATISAVVTPTEGYDYRCAESGIARTSGVVTGALAATGLGLATALPVSTALSGGALLGGALYLIMTVGACLNESVHPGERGMAGEKMIELAKVKSETFAETHSLGATLAAGLKHNFEVAYADGCGFPERMSDRGAQLVKSSSNFISETGHHLKSEVSQFWNGLR